MPIDSPPKREAASLAGSRFFLFLLDRLHFFETPHQKLPLLGRAVGSQDDVAFFEFFHLSPLLSQLPGLHFVNVDKFNYLPGFCRMKGISHSAVCVHIRICHVTPFSFGTSSNRSASGNVLRHFYLPNFIFSDSDGYCLALL